MSAVLTKPLEQDMIDLAREGLAVRIRRAQNRRWRLENAKRELEQTEQLNQRAIEKLGDPQALERERRELLDLHRRQLDELRDRASRSR